MSELLTETRATEKRLPAGGFLGGSDSIWTNPCLTGGEVGWQKHEEYLILFSFGVKLSL